jgi:hypothetical protein
VSFLAGLGLKLLGWGSGLLSWLKTIPWYVWVALAAVLFIYVDSVKLSRRDATIAANRAAFQHTLATWQTANALNAHSVQVLLGAVRAGNSAVSAYQAREATVTASATRARQAAALAAQSRDHAIAILKGAKPVTHDCAAPTEHNQVESEL